MRLQTKLVLIGNGYAVRLPKKILELVDFKPGQMLDVEVRPDRLILRLPSDKQYHKNDQAYLDFIKHWRQLGDDAWLQMFGPDYDGPGPHYGT